MTWVTSMDSPSRSTTSPQMVRASDFPPSPPTACDSRRTSSLSPRLQPPKPQKTQPARSQSSCFHLATLWGPGSSQASIDCCGAPWAQLQIAPESYHLQLTRYDKCGLARDVLHERDGALADERDRNPAMLRALAARVSAEVPRAARTSDVP